MDYDGLPLYDLCRHRDVWVKVTAWMIYLQRAKTSGVRPDCIAFAQHCSFATSVTDTRDRTATAGSAYMTSLPSVIEKKARRRHLREGLPMYSNLLRSVSISYDVAGGCSAAIRCEDVGQDNRSESQRGDRVTARAQHIMSHQVVMLTEPTKRMPFNGCD